MTIADTSKQLSQLQHALADEKSRLAETQATLAQKTTKEALLKEQLAAQRQTAALAEKERDAADAENSRLALEMETLRHEVEKLRRVPDAAEVDGRVRDMTQMLESVNKRNEELETKNAAMAQKMAEAENAAKDRVTAAETRMAEME